VDTSDVFAYESRLAPRAVRLRWNSMLNEKDILARLILLRKQGYINFRVPPPHGRWTILIDKYEPTCDDHQGSRLDAFVAGSLTNPVYVPLDPERCVGGYTMFRNGVRDHIKKGRFTPTEWLVFSTCLLWADWTTGNFEGNAQGICTLWRSRVKVRAVQKSMKSLKDSHYVSYENPKGKKGFISITVHKNHITFGDKKGTRVSAYDQTT
jgi:hypothetical protein